MSGRHGEEFLAVFDEGGVQVKEWCRQENLWNPNQPQLSQNETNQPTNPGNTSDDSDSQECHHEDLHEVLWIRENAY